MVDPAFFYEWDEERAGFFGGLEVEGVEGVGVGVRLNGSGSGEDDDLAFGSRLRRFTHLSDDEAVAKMGHPVLRRFVLIVGGGLGSRLDDSYDGDGEVGADFVECEGGGGVAGDDEEVCALGQKEAGAGKGVTNDGLAGLGAVGETGGVAEVDVIRVGDEGQEIVKDGEAAKAGVEDTDGEVVMGRGGAGHF